MASSTRTAVRILIALTVLVGIAGVVVGQLSSRPGDEPDWQQGQIAPTATFVDYIVITPPASWPTPFFYVTQEDVINDMRVRMETTAIWTETYAKKTRYSHFHALQWFNQYPHAETTEMEEFYDQIVWVLGFRTVQPFGVDELYHLIGLPVRTVNLDYETTAAYIVTTDYGQVIEATPRNYLGGDDSTPEVPHKFWELEDIPSLPDP